MNEILCFCGNELYYDETEETFLCPARFDGTHSETKQRELYARLRKISEDRSRAGKLGGPARAASLSPARRAEIASRAANTRWSK